MATNFPLSLDNFTNPTVNDSLNSATVPHSAQHANANDAIEALQAKVGIDSSANTASLDYRVAALESTPVTGTAWGYLTGTLGDQLDLVEKFSGKADATGFPVDALGDYTATLSYNEGTRTVTITPVGGIFDIYVRGTRHTFVGPQSMTFTDVQGPHFIYFDADGVLTHSTSQWNILLHAMVAYVYWDAANNRGICFDERHHAGRDLYWHRNQHAAEGTKAVSGFGVSGYTLNNGATNGAVTYSIASGVVSDEDVNVTTSVLPSAGPYTLLQRVGASGDWQIDRTKVRPFFDTGTALQYNQFTGGAWQLTQVPEDNFVNYWVFALTSITASDQFAIVPGQAVFATEALAHAESVSSLNWGTMPFQEIAPLYQVTMRYNASNPTAFANTAKCAISRIARVVGTNASITQAAQTDHGSLAGLVDDDHIQYALTTSGSVRAHIDVGASPTDAHLLVWNAAEAKLKLSAPSAGGAAWGSVTSKPGFLDWTFISEGSSTVDLAALDISIPVGSYDEVMIDIRFSGSSSGEQPMRMRLGKTTIDTGTNYSYSQQSFSSSAAAISSAGNWAQNTIQLIPNVFSGASTPDTHMMFGQIIFRGLNIPIAATDFTTLISGDFYGLPNDTSALPCNRVLLAASWINNTSVADMVQFYPGGGNITAYAYKVYGRSAL